ncbi:hypothetical protein [Nonomuraea sp. NPDC049709]|uniref:hypothetical protein n=1 Tax=Nonomuraea sp. NPDC049709 TaxID=3154736 RepID=UPI0034417739
MATDLLARMPTTRALLEELGLQYMIMAGHTPAAAESCLAEVPAWQQVDAEVLTSYAVAYAGYWTRMSRQPAPEGVPHLRPYQRHAATAALAWVRHRADTISPVTRAGWPGRRDLRATRCWPVRPAS